MQTGTTYRPSVATLCVALVVVGVGAGVGLATVPRVGTVLGMLVGGLVVGLAAADRPLTESAIAAVVADLVVVGAAGVPGAGIAGGIAALGSVALGTLVPSLVLSAFAGGFGAHLGDDLRDGLSTPVEDRGSQGATTVSPPDPSVASGEDALDEDAEAGREMVRESADE